MSATPKTDQPAAPLDPALRRERFGWYSYDWATSVFSSTVVTVFLGPYLTDIAERAAGPDGDVRPLGIAMPPGSLFGYTLSLSVFLQVFILPLLGATGHRVDYLIVDEAPFLTGEQVEQLAELVDAFHVDVYAFGLTTDFRARLFTGTQRLFELADSVQRVQVEVLCWCGLPGLLNARVVDGTMVREGATVVVADTAPAAVPSTGSPAGDDESGGVVRYRVLCRRHYVRGQLEPTPTGPGQLALR